MVKLRKQPVSKRPFARIGSRSDRERGTGCFQKFRSMYYIIIFILSILSAVTSNAQPQRALPDTISLGYDIQVSSRTDSRSVTGVDSKAFEYSTAIDVTKSLYGKIAGLNVLQGSGSSADNVSSLLLRGHEPLVLVDGFPRSLADITSEEIESVYVLTDAASSALYGVRGGNGVLMVTTRRGKADSRNISVQYGFGLNTPFRNPEFADAYTYASAVNTALAYDGLAPRYNASELEAFRSGAMPYGYPDVDWWDETMDDFGTTHSLKLTFSSGSRRFRHYTVMDFYRDRSMLKESDTDSRYDTTPTDTRLSLRTNIDVEITPSTFLKAGLAAKLQELNGTAYGRNNIITTLYNTPSAAFPVRHEDGVYGGSQVYGDANPVALLMDRGHRRNMYGTLLADMSLRQDLDILTEGLFAEVLVSFDNKGGMTETTSKTSRYMDLNPTISSDGTLYTNPTYYGTDSRTLGHSQPFESLHMSSDFQAKAAYDRHFKAHHVNAAAIYDMQSSIHNGRNNSHKNQSVLLNAGYSYADRYVLNAVVNWSGSSYLPEGSRFHIYPAASAAWVISNEKFMKKASWLNLLKLRASYGVSGWDGDLTHELWRQSYGAGGSYIFGSNAATVNGGAEGRLPVIGLVPEKSTKMTLGLDMSAFDNRLALSVEGFGENRSNVLVSGSSSTSGVIGIDVSQTCEGEYLYQGFDGTLTWYDKVGDFNYGFGASASYLMTEIVNENQAYQEYDYLYTKGNRIGQCYGLEAVGFFDSQLEINNSVPQSFSTLRPGDVKYKDQNADNVIDAKDKVKMFGSTLPRFYFGFSLEMGYKGFEVLADFQGICGVTVNLLDSPLYKPLVNNGNISATLLENETLWSPEGGRQATLPRLTTRANANNYQASSLWYRDGSFFKLRNLVLSYTFPKSMLKFADMKLFLQGCNLFSLDNIGFADPEQLEAAYPSVRTFLAGIKFNF